MRRDSGGQTPFMRACSEGNLAVAELLYKGNEYQRDWVDHSGRTALHLAIEGTNADVISFCVDTRMVIALDAEQLSFFDRILCLNKQRLAKAVVSHKRWEECIDIHSPDKPHPILRILDQMPDIYQSILDQCHTKCGLDPSHPDYWEEFNFKCLNIKLMEDSKQNARKPINPDVIELSKAHPAEHHRSRVAAIKRLSIGAQRSKGSLAVIDKLMSIN